MARIMEGKLRVPGIFSWVEERLNTGEQDWKQYTLALLVFNTALFVYGYLILSIQPCP
jgi:K+-transporting ATPase ATPase A chain